NFEDYRECHIRTDLILIYRKTYEEIHILRLESLGSHRQVLGIE
ncbi:MAG: type II toxin-antitoxin system mRNA interferase toxin, RelE/StbE family, partial [Pyramidobacter sp.]|nr:type II toxin-antitoxin system mRNA interferase toxin, RelE/StbE family [Pyramidobacter sp.]